MVEELEKQFLAKIIPEGLKNCKSKEIIDIYIPKKAEHPVIRIRKNGSFYEMTKKTVVGEKGHFEEQTIKLSKEEFEVLKKLDGKVLHKIRYYYPYKERTAEISVFQGALKGLVDVEFEFETKEERDNFEMPEFCLADVTDQEFTAGGYLCGKSYEEIEERLEKYGFERFYSE